MYHSSIDLHYLFFFIYFILFLFTLVFPILYAIYNKSSNLFTISIFSIINIFWFFYSFFTLSNIIIIFYFFLWIYLSFLAKTKNYIKKFDKKWITAFLSLFLPLALKSLSILSVFFLIHLIYEPILKNIFIKLKNDLSEIQRNKDKLFFLLIYFAKNILFLISFFCIAHFFIIYVIGDIIFK
jgi:hypothetical protein